MVGKEWADGAINLASSENFAFTGTAFALNEPAGDASAGIGVLAIINSEWKEVLSFARLRSSHCCGEDNVIADSYQRGAGRLFGQTASFKFESLTACEFNGCVLLHGFLISWSAASEQRWGALIERKGTRPSLRRSRVVRLSGEPAWTNEYRPKLGIMRALGMGKGRFFAGNLV